MDVMQRGAVMGHGSLSGLVETLEEWGDRTTVEGWSRAHTARRRELEHAIAAMVQASPVPWTGSRIRCALDVDVRFRDALVHGVVRAVARGGLLIELSTRKAGFQATLHWQAPSGMRRSPVTGQIVGIEGTSLRVALARENDVADRWTRRLIVDAVRSRVEWRSVARATLR